jgi:pyridoxine kinase
MLQGIEANGLFGMCDAVLTGYFTSEAQIEIAADAIDRIRATPRQRAHDHAPASPFVVVDPIIGDTGGRYVADGVAAGLIRHLVPRADLVACNHWEFCEIAACGHAASAIDVARTARSTGRDWMVTSVPVDSGVGVVLTSEQDTLLAVSPHRGGRVPQGAGDFLKLRYVGGRVTGEAPRQALARAVGATSAIITRAVLWDTPELPLAACQDVIANPPEAEVFDLNV